MSYPDVLKTTECVENLLSRKEFAQLQVTPVVAPDRSSILNRIFLDEGLFTEGKLFLHQPQQFIRNFMSPNTNRKRILGKWDTGTGKTNAALVIASKFIEYYKQQYDFVKYSRISENAEDTPLVFIIGFSKAIFQKELLRRPEFGFITHEEIQEQRRLRYLAETGTQSDKEVLIEFESKLKKRLAKKAWGGFFKFIGYKEFFNRLFTFDENFSASLSETENVEDTVMNGIKDGHVVLNYELIDAFANSLVICDEVHNVYNSIEINNYGIALRMLFNIYDIPDTMDKNINLQGKTSKGNNRLDVIKKSSLRVVLLTATPVNNSPTEIVDLLNLLVPQSELPNQNRLNKDDFFTDNRNLKKGALEQIQELIRGYISFLRNQNPQYFPERVLEGSRIRIPKKYLSERIHGYNDNYLPYLKFTVCEMSPLHYKTYKAVYQGTLPPDGQSLLDMVIPNPGLIKSDSTTSTTVNSDIGLFRSKDIRFSLQHAPQKWKDKYQIDIIKQEGIGHNVITGEFMRLPTLKKYSTKYATMVELLFDNIKTNKGKVLIIHQYIKMSGVLFIQEVLRRNGFIDEHSTPTDDTLCVLCGLRRHNHKKDHEFVPTRFITVYGEMDSLTRNRSIEKFNNSENVNGVLYRILVGSKVINESVDFNAVQNIWIMSVPPNIPTLIQILGRAIRNGSHRLLPPEKRKTHVRIFTSSVPSSSRSSENDDLSYEDYKYFEKLMDYLIIQQIEKVFNMNAIDAPLYRNIIFPPIRDEKTHKIRHSYEDELGTLYFDMSPVFGKKWAEIADNKKQLTRKDLDLSTFYPHYSSEEIENIIYIIKRLFIEQSTVWTYEELLASVRGPPFITYVNTGLFLEEDFLIALDVLCPSFFSEQESINMASVSSERKRLLSRLFDPNDNKIVDKGVECQIIYKNGYFMLFPLYISQHQDDYSEHSLGLDGILAKGHPILETDSWYRREIPKRRIALRITDSLRTSNISYNQMKYRFYNQFVDTPIETIPTTVELYDLDFHVHLVEDAVRYVFNIYTNSSMPFSELHAFYFKILYFYDRLDMILFADQIEDTKLFTHYEPFVEKKGKIPFGLHESGKQNKSKKEYLLEEHGYNAFLMSSILKSEEPQVFNIDRLNEFLGKRTSSAKHHHPHLEDMDLDKQLMHSKKKRAKIFGALLPIGHFLTTNAEATHIPHAAIPKIYIPENEGQKSQPLWKRAAEFVLGFSESNEVENDILIGYYEKNPTGIDVKFKLRPPIQRIEYHEDSRMIERGSACNTRHKEDLIDIAKTLGLENQDKNQGQSGSIKDICTLIKLELMRREMNERRKWKHLNKKSDKTNIPKRKRWFYLHFERQQGE
jgi:hypothetical protein